MLAEAFNAVLALHSRAAVHRRLNSGNTSIAENIKITPSNYFRNLEGPSATIIKGREFIVSRASLGGFGVQKITFVTVPTSGVWRLAYNSVATTDIAFDAVASSVQTLLRLVTGLDQVTVTGDYTSGFTITMIGLLNPLTIVGQQQTLDVAPGVSLLGNVQWVPLFKRGDRIEDTSPNGTGEHYAVDEIIEMHDLGAALMGWRLRME